MIGTSIVTAISDNDSESEGKFVLILKSLTRIKHCISPDDSISVDSSVSYVAKLQMMSEEQVIVTFTECIDESRKLKHIITALKEKFKDVPMEVFQSRKEKLLEVICNIRKPEEMERLKNYAIQFPPVCVNAYSFSFSVLLYFSQEKKDFER